METGKPKNLAEVVQKMSISATPIEEESTSVDDGTVFIPAPNKKSIDDNTDQSTDEVPIITSYEVDEETEQETKPIPDWVVFPPKFKIPSGRTVMFIRLLAKWTDTPKKGDRIIICWPLNDGEEDRALERTKGKGYRVPTECAKGMIRAIDGKTPLWPGMLQPEHGEGVSIDTFWRDIGAKCRSLLEGIYMQTHRMQEQDLFDFFKSCMDTRTVG